MAVRVVGMDHMVLRVRDPVTSVKWYQRVLGLEPVRLQEFQEKQVPFPSTRVNPMTLIDFMAIQQEQQGAQEQQGGSSVNNMDHFCLCLEPGLDMEQLRDTLDDIQGVQVQKQFDGYVCNRFGAQGTAKSVYITDLDGNTIELRSYPS